jgi:hypothetical protein
MYSIVIFKIFWRGVHGVVRISREDSDFGTWGALPLPLPLPLPLLCVPLWMHERLCMQDKPQIGHGNALLCSFTKLKFILSSAFSISFHFKVRFMFVSAFCMFHLSFEAHIQLYFSISYIPSIAQLVERRTVVVNLSDRHP